MTEAATASTGTDPARPGPLPPEPLRGVGGLLLAAFLAACAPEVYRDDVGRFAGGVTAATDTFALLQSEDLARQQAEFQDEIVTRHAAVGLTDACQDLLLKLQGDAACLADWAAFRRGVRERPACPEPEGFYTLPPDAGASCRLGAESGSGFRPAGPEPALAYPLLGELNRRLQAYATGLAEITAADDGAALTSAVGDARDALVRVDQRVGEVSGRPATANLAVGPVADLLGSALTTALEARRYQALRTIVTRADPVVRDAAMLLSRAAMPLLVRARLRPAQEALQNAAERARRSGPNDPEYSGRVAAAAQALAFYRAQLAADPSAVFAAMADAHAKLAAAINDPRTQFEAMRSAVGDFAAKAKAAYEAVKAQREAGNPAAVPADVTGFTLGAGPS